ncbi:hypothetical protein ACFQY0_04695 [Haloferula chungangensis]|uniref:HEAT repeat domain-containing protein n=1 Tax=Haloferula chungangensis TaxID=1048331 RepID=A0ABW2L4Q1_9BACT
MNVRFLIPPLTAMAVAGVLLGRQRSSIGELKSEMQVLQERIEMTRLSMRGGADQSLVGRLKDKKEANGSEFDWKELGSKIAQSERGNAAEMRTMLELKTTLMSLSGDELLAELAKIDALDLSKDVRNILNRVFVEMLVKKDPKAALDRFLVEASEQGNRMSWELSNAYKEWQKQDPAAALAWFDSEISKGSFDSRKLDGKSDSRLRFEAVALRHLLGSDPDDARRRIEALPEDQRKQVFNLGMLSGLKEDSYRSFADLVRAVVPEGDQGEAYHSTVSHLAGKGFDKVDGFILKIDASEGEKAAIVTRAAESGIQKLSREGRINRTAVDDIRSWAATQSPENADAITGKSLANVWGETSSFDDRARIVEELHSEGASDDLLVSFVRESQKRQQPRELVRSLAAQVRDQAEREKLLGTLRGGSDPSPPSDGRGESINQK